MANCAIGYQALVDNTTGNGNTAIGTMAMLSNESASFNTAIGDSALAENFTGASNTAIGAFSLQLNESGSNNTATGYNSLDANLTGSNNTGTGSNALGLNTSGSNNTATGYLALAINTVGVNNAATGTSALGANVSGNYNTANGQGTLSNNTTGSNNTAVGQNALRANITGTNNIAIGSNAGSNLTTGNNNIDIFSVGVAGESNAIRIGRQGTQTGTYIAGISGATIPSGASVVVDTTGHLGTVTSSARYKEDIEPMAKKSEVLLSLQPVSFRYRAQLDPKGIPQFGLVAEQVAKVDPDLVLLDEMGKPYTVRYDAVNAMLLNEFIKEHAQMQSLRATIETQQKALDAQQRQINDLRAAFESTSGQRP
jgi:hypothetical protein